MTVCPYEAVSCHSSMVFLTSLLLGYLSVAWYVCLLSAVQLANVEAVEQKAVCYLRSKVVPHLDALWKASLLAAEVDVLLSLSELAKEPSWVCPEIVEERVVDIEDGLHPLAEVTVPNLVANSTNLDTGSVACVTGPVFSGKSVYCAQVALIVLLAQVGSFVPATRARMGVFDALFTRVKSTDSVSVGQSSFFTDCSQIANMLQQATRRSLLVVDEFGKGTNEQDGLSLLGSLILDIIKRPTAEAPILLLTTHFWEVLAEPYVPMADRRLHVFSMDVLIRRQGQQTDALPPLASFGATRAGRVAPPDSNRDDDGQAPAAALAAETLDGQQVVYLYKLKSGVVSAQSHSLQCALLAGVERGVCERAAEVRSCVWQGDWPTPATY